MKKVLFAIFAVIFSLGVATADEIKELTLDTPVDWSVSAFNRAVLRFCKTEHGVGFFSVDDKKIGEYSSEFTYFVGDEEVHKKGSIISFDKTCGVFIVKYATAYKQNNKISLRSIINMCMDSSMDAFTCGNIAKALVAYSLNQNASKQAETEINNMPISTKRWYSEGGEFYVNVNMSFADMTSGGAPQLSDTSVYLAITGEPVGLCDYKYVSKEDNGFGTMFCDMIQNYAWWECMINLDSRQQLSCVDKYIVYQNSVINNFSKMLTWLKEDLSKAEGSKAISKSQKECVKITIESQIRECNNLLSEFGPVQTKYSYDRWKKTKELLNKSIGYDRWQANKECF